MVSGEWSFQGQGLDTSSKISLTTAPFYLLLMDSLQSTQLNGHSGSKRRGLLTKNLGTASRRVRGLMFHCTPYFTRLLMPLIHGTQRLLEPYFIAKKKFGLDLRVSKDHLAGKIIVHSSNWRPNCAEV